MHDLIPQSDNLIRLETSQVVLDIARVNRQPPLDTPESISK